ILCSPFTGPSTGPSPMASITLIICVDLRLSFASRGVCALPPPLPITSPLTVIIVHSQKQQAPHRVPAS
ncbi:hypothetical protein DLU55_27255, partial [Escherichia coli]|nr:hypothetical protein [Escherichia coli]